MTKDEIVDLVRRLKPMGVSECTLDESGNFSFKIDTTYQARGKRSKRSKNEHSLPLDALNPANWSPLTTAKPDPRDMSTEDFEKTLFYST